MPAQRVKIEFYDGGGTKHTLCIEGSLSKEKVSRVLDYVELMGRLPQTTSNALEPPIKSKFESIRDLATVYMNRPFKSQDIQQKYEERYGQRISLSTASTYLSRLVDRGVLERSGGAGGWTYVMKPPGTLSWTNILDK